MNFINDRYFEYIVSEILEGRVILSLLLLEWIPAAVLPLGTSLTTSVIVVASL